MFSVNPRYQQDQIILPDEAVFEKVRLVLLDALSFGIDAFAFNSNLFVIFCVSRSTSRQVGSTF